MAELNCSPMSVRYDCDDKADDVVVYPIAYFHFQGWSCVGLGVRFSLDNPNVEISLPFGFLRFGFNRTTKGCLATYPRKHGFKKYNGKYWSFGVNV